AGKPVASFTIAVQRRFKNKNGEYDADFINCVAWGSTAEYISNHIDKGRLIGVEGRLQIRTYENKDGKKVWVTEVIADSVESLEKKKASGDSGDTTTEEYGADDIPF
ncbi:MAG: single-stranded DNA-binding protein, partial [Anaerovoracaceae bacterium]